MKFTSTRNKELCIGFTEAICDCMPEDGGLYIPCKTEDLRKWITYTDENTSFSSIAGTLTSAFLNEELSPIICETISTRAFKFSPEFRQIDEKLFMLELNHGPSGSHKDFGLSFLINSLETIFQWKGGNAVFCDVSTGYLGAMMAHCLRGKKYLKAVLVYPEGKACGIEEEDLVWNGGNIYPVEVKGSEEDCHKIVRKIFADRAFVLANKLTVANTANIGRLLPQAYFYPFAFSRIKNRVCSDIYYALDAGNYSNVVAGLYSWQFALPLNGFVVPSTDALTEDSGGLPLFLDSMVPMKDRLPADPAEPSNLERLEAIFNANQLMMRHFVFPKMVEEKEVFDATRELFMKYKILGDKSTSRAYAACKKFMKSSDEEENAMVLVARDHSCHSIDYIRHTIGEVPETPENVLRMKKSCSFKMKSISSSEDLRKIIEEVNK